MVLALGSCREASGHRDAAVGSAWADLAGGLAEAQHSTLRVQLHLLQLGFLITLLSALTHHSLQDEEWGYNVLSRVRELISPKHQISKAICDDLVKSRKTSCFVIPAE